MKHILLFLFTIVSIAIHAQERVESYDLAQGSFQSYPNSFTIFKDKLYFVAAAPSSNRTLWVIDDNWLPEPALKNIKGRYHGVGNYKPSLCAVGNQLYFSCFEDSLGLELYSCDSAGAYSMAADVWLGANSGNPENMIMLDGKIYFTGGLSNRGYQLYSYDTKNSVVTTLTTDGVDATPSGFPELALFKGKFYFNNSAGVANNELYSYDPVTQTTSLAWDFTKARSGGQPAGMIVLGDKMYMVAQDTATGFELYSFDGTTAVRLTDLMTGKPGSVSTKVNTLYGYDDKVYFSATADSVNYHAYELDTKTGFIKRIGMETSPHSFIHYHDKLYYMAADTTYGLELRVYDGKSVSLVKDLNPGRADGGGIQRQPLGYGSWCAVFKDDLYFMGTDGANGYELHKLTSKWPVAVDKAHTAGGINIYPNPTTGILHINMPYSGMLSVYDIQGRAIYNAALVKNDNTITLPVSLATGTYILKLDDGKGGIPVHKRITLQQ